MSYSVLVVDDEELTLRTVSRGLHAEGFEVFTAPSGEEAFKVFAEEKPRVDPARHRSARHRRSRSPAPHEAGQSGCHRRDDERLPPG